LTTPGSRPYSENRSSGPTEGIAATPPTPVAGRPTRRSDGVAVERWRSTIVSQAGDLAAAVGRERGHVVIGRVRSEVAARSTNLFRRENGAWRMIGHHVDPHVPDHA
jgi:hypothetical protein